MYKELFYKRIIISLGLLYVIGIFIELDNVIGQAVIDLVHDTMFFLMVIFGYLWKKRRIILIGLVIYTVEWNIDLFTNSLTLVNNSFLLSREILIFRAILNTIGFICLILGGINKIIIPFLTDKLKYEIGTIGIGISLLTIIIQLTARLY